MGEPQVNPYLRDAVLTATPEQLQLMLYDGAIRNALQARDAILAKDFEASFHKLLRAQQIILEMLNGLNFDVNPELCGQMSAIYNFLYRKLIDASIERDAKHIDDAMKVLLIERETWQLLVDKVSRIRLGEIPDSYEPGWESGQQILPLDPSDLAALPPVSPAFDSPVLRLEEGCEISEAAEAARGTTASPVCGQGSALIGDSNQRAAGFSVNG